MQTASIDAKRHPTENIELVFIKEILPQRAPQMAISLIIRETKAVVSVCVRVNELISMFCVQD